jgi:hypothetical protein
VIRLRVAIGNPLVRRATVDSCILVRESGLIEDLQVWLKPCHFFAAGRTKSEQAIRTALAQLRQHVVRLDIVGVVVEYALQLSDLADGLDGQTPDLADALRNRVCHVEDLLGLFIKHAVITADVRSAQMPMEVFGFEVE